MAVFRSFTVLTSLTRMKSQSLRLIPCRSVMAPFQGKIEGVSTSWKPIGRIKEHQDSLAYQPVPPLTQTMERFLQSVRCLLTDQEYDLAIKLTQEFSRPGGEGEKLQELLMKRAETHENWLSDLWIKVAYLGNRQPGPVYVNPSIACPPLDMYPGVEGQLRLASRIIRSQIEYKYVIDKQEIPIEKIGGNPQCMIQHHHILGCCRVPGPGVDHVVCHHAHDPTAPKHIVVIHNNHFFEVQVIDSNNTMLSLDQLKKQLEKVVSQSQTKTTAIGLLTAANRDTWYQAYKALCEDPRNAGNFAKIHQSLFVLSLDQPIPNYSRDKHYEIVSWSHMGGGGSHVNSGNRYNDKVIQYYVNSDGIWGCAFEHSVAEGPPILDLLARGMNVVDLAPPPQIDADGTYSEPHCLQFTISPAIEETINQVGQEMDKVMNEVNVRFVHIDKKDRDVPFKKLQIYPDGFVQANIQLAYYKMYGRLVSTYESGSLRKFRLGRTDTIRSASLPVLEWCKAMADKSVSREEKIAKLRAATTHHAMYTLQVVEGQSIDRHLLGLKLMALESGVKMPEFLIHSIYTQSTSWTLSTTTVPMAKGGTVVFGPVVPDGYGLYYNRQKEWIEFGVSSWNNPNTDVDRFVACLREAFDESLGLFHPNAASKL